MQEKNNDNDHLELYSNSEERIVDPERQLGEQYDQS